MSKSMLAVFAALALAGCGRGDKRDVASADSLNRDLQLAPVDTQRTAERRAGPGGRYRGDAGARAAQAPAAAQAGAQAKAEAGGARRAGPVQRPLPKPHRHRHRLPPRPRACAPGATFTATTDAEIRSQQEQGR